MVRLSDKNEETKLQAGDHVTFDIQDGSLDFRRNGEILSIAKHLKFPLTAFGPVTDAAAFDIAILIGLVAGLDCLEIERVPGKMLIVKYV